MNRNQPPDDSAVTKSTEKNQVRKDRWITVLLVLFCAGMTFWLIRSEFFPESSLLHQLPPRYIAERFLKNDSTSSMKILWKGEDIGSFMVRVTPGKKPFLKSLTDLVIPILGQKPRVNIEMDCRLNRNREVEWLRLHGGFQEIRFEVLADTLNNKIKFTAHGGGVEEKHEFVLSEFTSNNGRDLLGRIQGLPPNISLPSRETITAMSRDIQVDASVSRIRRLGDWMDAYLLHTRLDANSWVKLWVSLTGDILKLESSFGLSAINEDFFQGTPAM